MRSKKNLVIGFLLLFLGIGLSEYSLPLSILAGVAGIVMMILYAAGKLKRNTSETSAVSSKTSKIQPPTKTQQADALGVSFSPEAQQLYQQLADQYAQIVNNGCFGSLSQIEGEMDRCKCFLEQWMEALCNKDFVALLKNKAKYNQYVDCFGKAYIDGIGDYLLFALAYRWISKIVCCANPHGRKTQLALAICD